MNSTRQTVAEMSFRKTPRHIKRSISSSPIRKLSIVIPCFNEAGTISDILDKVLDAPLPFKIEKEIIVVNDCSTDDTDLMVQEYLFENQSAPIRYIIHSSNQGKGASVHTGISAASGDYMLIQDADLEYDPREYEILLEPILAGHADVVYGSRFMGGHAHRILFFWHTVGNKLLTFISNLFTNMTLTDAHTCYKVLPLSLIKNIPLKEKRFAFDVELNARMAEIPGIRIYEVGISYYGRTFSEGKKIRMHDAIRSIFCLIKCCLFTQPGKKRAITVPHPKNSTNHPIW